MKFPLLLDTCACIWMIEQRLGPVATGEVETRQASGSGVWVSPISGFELGMLFARGRLRSGLGPVAYFRRLLDSGFVALAEMPVEVLVNASFLPGEPPRDPWDRVIAATAREFGFAVMTRDRALLAYGASGHLKTVAC